MAALGGMTAVIALLSGPSSAKADELADLRANQELLQRRLDQLAQAPAPGNPFGVGSPPGPSNVQMMGGSFPRSFLIPGTDTSIRVGGEIDEVLDYWFNGGPPNSSPQTTTLGATGQAQSAPLHVHSGLNAAGAIVPAGNPARSRGDSIFSQSPRQSKLNIETRTPTPWGEARTYMEFDWAGSTNFSPGGATPTSVSDNLAPRLRFAYGTLGGFLAGQANSNFSDPDANAESLDFGGNVGEPGVTRVPQVRYTMPLAGWGIPGALSVSAETPETDAVLAGGLIIGSDASSGSPSGSLPAGTFNPTKSPAPDITAAWYIPQPWGHMDFSAVVRPEMEFKDGAFVDRSFVGYGAHFGGDVKPGWFGWAKDDITFHFVGGDAIGRYLNSGSNFGLASNYPSNGAPATAALAANVLIKPVRSYGGEVGYQHWWMSNLRSTISGGVHWRDVDSRVVGCAFNSAAALAGTGSCALNKEVITTHANVIWNPVPFVDVGLEYTWSHRLVLSNLKGDQSAVIGKFGVKF
ncbi:MAG TPA: porin [Stellaceae bacterium]|nr:porin [Stellaceae bacterium]